MKPLIKTLVLFSIVCLAIPKVNSQEVCEKHNNLEDTYEAQNCTLYCCGSCNRRYCCNSRAIRLNQELCVPEDCLAYYDNLQVHYQRAYCFGRFCCGKCNYRYCCSDTSLRLDQSSCPNREPTKTTNSGYFLPDTSRKLNKSISWFYWSIAILCILILGFFIWRAFSVRRRNRQITRNDAINNLLFHSTPPTPNNQRQIWNNIRDIDNFLYPRNTTPNLNNQRQIWNNIRDIDNFLYPRNTTPNLNNQQNNTNIAASAPEPLINNDQPFSSTNETDNISITVENVDEDLPPSYASLITKDKTKEESVEANANNP